MNNEGLGILSKRELLCRENIGPLKFWKYYVFGKQKRVHFSSPIIHKTKGTVDYIHSDLLGPTRVSSKGDVTYILTFIDNYLRKVLVHFLKHNNDICLTFNQSKVLIEK